MSAAFRERSLLLFRADEYAEFIELHRLTLAAREHGGWDAIFLFLRRSFRPLAEHTSRHVHDGFHWIDYEGTRRDRPRFPPTPRHGERNDVRAESGNALAAPKEPRPIESIAKIVESSA